MENHTAFVASSLLLSLSPPPALDHKIYDSPMERQTFYMSGPTEVCTSELVHDLREACVKVHSKGVAPSRTYLCLQLGPLREVKDLNGFCHGESV